MQHPQDEIARFSHMIPSSQLICKERRVFELDPLSVPRDEKVVVDLGNLKILPGNFKPSFEGSNDVDHSSGDESEDSDQRAPKLPDPEFFNFELKGMVASLRLDIFGQRTGQMACRKIMC